MVDIEPFCDGLDQTKCTLLEADCFRLKQKKKCDFYDHYKKLIYRDPAHPITTKCKETMFEPFMNAWRDYAASPSPGKKNMTGGPLEKSIRAVLNSELSEFDANVSMRGKKIKMYGDVPIIVDALIDKTDYPRSIISVKSWIGPTQIRETFAYAYFYKMWEGQKNVRVYMVSLNDIKKYLTPLFDVCKPFIDDYYSLSSKPFFDDLVTDLKKLYK